MSETKIDIFSLIKDLKQFAKPVPTDLLGRKAPRKQTGDKDQFIAAVNAQLQQVDADMQASAELKPGLALTKRGDPQLIPAALPDTNARGARTRWYRMMNGVWVVSLFLGNMKIGEPVAIVGGWDGLKEILNLAKTAAEADVFKSAFAALRAESIARRESNAELRAKGELPPSRRSKPKAAAADAGGESVGDAAPAPARRGRRKAAAEPTTAPAAE